MKDPNRGCFFCGQKPRTKEHILPNWLGKAIPEWTRSAIYKHEGPAQVFESKQFDRPLLRSTVKETCAACNNGWMSTLEQLMVPHLARLIVGQPTILNRQALETIARWAVKTHMMRTQVDSGGFGFPQEDKDDCRFGREPSRGWSVWLGHTWENGVSHRNWSAGIEFGDTPETVTFSHTTLSMGGLLLVVAYVSDPQHHFHMFYEVERTCGQEGVSLIRISDAMPFAVWPPGPPAGVDGVRAVSDVALNLVRANYMPELPVLPHIGLEALGKPHSS